MPRAASAAMVRLECGAAHALGIAKHVRVVGLALEVFAVDGGADQRGCGGHQSLRPRLAQLQVQRREDEPPIAVSRPDANSAERAAAGQRDVGLLLSPQTHPAPTCLPPAFDEQQRASHRVRVPHHPQQILVAHAYVQRSHLDQDGTRLGLLGEDCGGGMDAKRQVAAGERLDEA